MKKELISPMLNLSAMILVIASSVFSDNRAGDIIGYLAIILALFSIYQIIQILKKPK